MNYNIIQVFTREGVRWRGKLLYDAVIEFVRSRRIAARVMVSKGVAGCYENGEVSSHATLDLSYNMPLKIEIILPAPELEPVLHAMEEMVTDGIVLVEEKELRFHKTAKNFLPQYLKVKDIMVSQPVTVDPDCNLSEIVERLLSSGLTWVPIVGDKMKIQGIIAQKELVRAGVPILLGLAALMDFKYVQGKVAQLPQKKAAELMASPAVTVKEDQYLPEVVRLMLKKGLKRLPVVNDREELVGIIARLDVMRAIIENAPDWALLEKRHVIVANKLLVKDMVNRESPVVKFDTPVIQVVESLKAGYLQRAAVVDSRGVFIGLITDYELFPLLQEHTPDVWGFFASILRQSQTQQGMNSPFSSITAEQVMRREIVVVPEDTPFEDAIRIMIDKELKRIPVIDRMGLYKGMISRDAILRMLL